MKTFSRHVFGYRKFFAKAVFLIATLAVAVGLFTWWALESSGVAIVETRAPSGSKRSTHVWFVETEGELWVEAGSPGNPWFLDVQRDPQLTLRSSGPSGEFVAQIHEDADARARLRSRLRSKYGVRDDWVAIAFDTSESVAVRLIRAAP